MTSPAAPKSTNASAVLAGRLVLAVADDDGCEVARILGHATVSPPGLLAVIIELANLTVGLAQDVDGDDWRARLGFTILDLDALPEGES